MSKEVILEDSDWDFDPDEISMLTNFEPCSAAQSLDVPIPEVVIPAKDVHVPVIKKRRVRKPLNVDTLSRKIEKAMTLINIALESFKEITEQLDDLPKPRKRKLNN